MHEKVILVYQYPFSKRDFHRLGCEWLVQHGYDVHIWNVDISGAPNFEYTGGMFKGKELEHIIWEELDVKVKENNEAVFFLFTDIDYNPICRIFSKYSVRWFYIGAMGAIPIDWTKRNTLGEKIKMFTTFLLKIKNHKYLHTLISIQRNPPEFVFASTKYAASFYLPNSLNKKDIVFLHSFDYDSFLEAKEQSPAINEKYIVLLDGGYFFKNRDFEEAGVLRNSEYEKKYFDRLDFFLAKLEKIYNAKVIVAGHPQTVYPSGAFSSRTLIFNQTANLVKNSLACISTTTTSISFPLLYDKPLHLYYSDILKIHISQCLGIANSHCLDDFEFTLNFFKIPLVNIDDMDYEIIPYQKVSDEIRKKYIHDFIIDESGEPERLYIEKISCFLEK